MLSSSAHAETVNYNVILDPSINIVLSTNTVALSLNPNTKTFDSTNLNVGVSTNNATGYHLVVTSPNDNTDLVNIEDSTKTIATLPALSGGYDDDSFVVNKWGYKISGNPYTSTNNKYIPFVSGTTLNYNYTTTNNDTTTLTFASKINYNQPAGTYNITLNFNAIANTDIPYIQDFTAEMCRNQATDQEVVVQDKRDLKSYTVRYINGNCWMTENLRLGEDDTNPDTTTIVLTPEDSNVTEERVLTVYDTVKYGDEGNKCYGFDGVGQTYSTPCMHSKDTVHNVVGVWYNYATATAGTITALPGATGSTDEATESICPSGWKLPSRVEQQALVNVIGSNPDIFRPVLGGRYYNKGITGTDRGQWWSSTSANDFRVLPRYNLIYDGSILEVLPAERVNNVYVRCIRTTSA